jgi:hypothetical protein
LDNELGLFLKNFIAPPHPIYNNPTQPPLTLRGGVGGVKKEMLPTSKSEEPEPVIHLFSYLFHKRL